MRITFPRIFIETLKVLYHAGLNVDVLISDRSSSTK